VGQLGLVDDLGGGPVHEHAPTRSVERVDGVDLERHLGAVAHGGELRAGVRADHDVVAVEDVVHGQDGRPAVVQEPDPSDVVVAEQLGALVAVQDGGFSLAGHDRCISSL